MFKQKNYGSSSNTGFNPDFYKSQVTQNSQMRAKLNEMIAAPSSSQSGWNQHSSSSYANSSETLLTGAYGTTGSDNGACCKIL